MAAPNFWNHQESAQATVQALKKLKALVEPMNGVISAADDIASKGKPQNVVRYPPPSLATAASIPISIPRVRRISLSPF